MPKPIVFLVGLRGSGKTTVGTLLAQRLGYSFVDADLVLEEKFGRNIQQIFADEGEASFRAKESEILIELCGSQKAVIATGGGVVLRPENRQRLQTGFVVWLTADAETLHGRIQNDPSTGQRRPPLAQGGLEEVRGIMKERELLYTECADLVVDTCGMTAEKVVAAICSSAHFQRDITI